MLQTRHYAFFQLEDRTISENRYVSQTNYANFYVYDTLETKGF